MKRIFKWLAIIAGLLIGLLIISILVLYGLGQYRLKKKYNIPIQAIVIPEDAQSLSEGKRIFQYRGCEACHGKHLEGLIYMNNPAIGKVITPNLTTGRGGIGGLRTDSDLVRAIKHGVRYNGTPLLFMPSTEFYYLSDNNLGKVLAYIRSVSPTDNEMPLSQLSFTGFLVMNLTRDITFLPAELIPHRQPPPEVPTPGITAEYGAYLSLSCHVCHGLSLSGGKIPGFPPEWPAAPNLTSGKGSRLPSWGEKGFIEIIQNGAKHGRAINSAFMPWTSYRYMTQDELSAVYLYLMSLTPKDFGNR